MSWVSGVKRLRKTVLIIFYLEIWLCGDAVEWGRTIKWIDYRSEVVWFLDRSVLVIQSFKNIRRKAVSFYYIFIYFRDKNE